MIARKFVFVTFVFVAVWAASLVAREAQAHTGTTTISTIDLVPGSVDWKVHIRLLDLAQPVGLPEDADASQMIGQVRSKRPQAAAFVQSQIGIFADGHPCVGRFLNAVDVVDAPEPTDEFRFAFTCPAGAGALRVRYELFFDLDRLHSGFASVSIDGVALTSHVFRNQAREFTLDGPPTGWQSALQYLRLGIEHIFMGYDHLAFLAALLLGVTLSQRGRAKGSPIEPKASGTRDALVGALKLVTAFTLAHSITLITAALRPSLVPTRWVEPAIAFSVAYVGFENLRARVPRRRWMLTFGFGLVHGFGFASVLQEIGLPKSGLIRSLLAFNVGVELGQMAVVSIILPTLVWAARRDAVVFERWILRVGSTGLAVAGVIWFVARVAG